MVPTCPNLLCQAAWDRSGAPSSGTKVQLFQVLSLLDCALIEGFFALLADETKSTTEVGYNQPRVAQRGDPK